MGRSFGVWAEVLTRKATIQGLGSGASVAPTTLKKMKDIINKSLRNFYIRRWAEIMTRDTRGDEEAVEGIYNFLASHTRYLKDPKGLELLKIPEVSLQLIDVGERPALDCDDLTILSLSLIKSIGIPVALRAASYDQDKVLRHVYGLVKIKNRGWVPFDLVNTPGFGIEPPFATNKQDVEV